MQSSGLTLVVPFVPFGCSSRVPLMAIRVALHSTDTSTAPKKEQLENKQLFFCAVSFLIFTRSLPAFVGAIASTKPLHFVTLRRLLFSALQPFWCLPPLVNWAVALSPSHRGWHRSLYESIATICNS